MKAQPGIVDLERLALPSGGAATLEFTAEPSPITVGNEAYAAPDERPPARLDVSRTSSGYALRLRFASRLVGPCVRCLEPAEAGFEIDAREVDQPGSDDEELLSPYVGDGSLDAGRWLQDAIVLEMPAQPVCRPDCAGLCVVCGEPLNDADPEAHRHGEAGDPRMAKLRDLKLE
ncbi:MAG: DUF177 domain-containing protein [Solirubrobacterales bacterium]|nr:DUF177 domain-containing protein [Solirubrobacterales bacterium]